MLPSASPCRSSGQERWPRRSRRPCAGRGCTRSARRCSAARCWRSGLPRPSAGSGAGWTGPSTAACRCSASTGSASSLMVDRTAAPCRMRSALPARPRPAAWWSTSRRGCASGARGWRHARKWASSWGRRGLRRGALVYVVTNDALARRQVKRGNIFLFTALAVFGAGVAVGAVRPDDTVASIATFGALMLGIFLWQLSLYYTRRWGPRERQDAALVKALKGLDNRYTLVIFSSPRLPDYLLIGPLGVRALVARGVAGTVRYRGGRWSRAGTPAWQALLLGDPLRNPEAEAKQSVERVEEH